MSIEYGLVRRKERAVVPAGTGTTGACCELRRGGNSSAGGMAEFAETALGWRLEDKQRELLTGCGKRVILNCTRQWGKSWMAAVALLFHAVHHAESLSIVAGPTLRQSAELLKKVKDLAWRMGLAARGDGINRQSVVLLQAHADARSVTFNLHEKALQDL